jgi:hypothetical protein
MAHEKTLVESQTYSPSEEDILAMQNMFNVEITPDTTEIILGLIK